ncbi:hypothetical protein ACMU_01540 [Actibacterium mucosum KCTC 23349]|uniref:NAD(P)-binding domain-containing protein n=1 Tax=Actibacterium mucosum KCTC 23349 TaxID=1454373 RepID=A0A037ZNS3_9RHOB|nr:SDR family oxidoreductase [Actibacterium mucosum]KAJ57203.1 hypothetical protein ACMU_01540 [Actibacterium mucosum KCTC 23349]
MEKTAKTVFVAGATGYLGRYLVAEFLSRGWHVRALVRSAQSARIEGLGAKDLIEAQATDPATLKGAMQGVDLVVSSLGITRQKDGLGYMDVDFQANANLLNQAIADGVPRFAYVHVLGAEKMVHVPLTQAKQAFVDLLNAAPIQATVVSPSGYFSDMSDFLRMAESGRVWLFGDGQKRLNPIHGADLARAVADAAIAGRRTMDVGGPDILTHKELAQMAFEAVGKPARITMLPDWIRRLVLRVLPWVTPRHIHGPAQFFLTAFGMDMVGKAVGKHHLADHFAETATA